MGQGEQRPGPKAAGDYEDRSTGSSGRVEQLAMQQRVAGAVGRDTGGSAGGGGGGGQLDLDEFEDDDADDDEAAADADVDDEVEAAVDAATGEDSDGDVDGDGEADAVPGTDEEVTVDLAGDDVAIVADGQGGWNEDRIVRSRDEMTGEFVTDPEENAQNLHEGDDQIRALVKDITLESARNQGDVVEFENARMLPMHFRAPTGHEFNLRDHIDAARAGIPGKSDDIFMKHRRKVDEQLRGMGKDVSDGTWPIDRDVVDDAMEAEFGHQFWGATKADQYENIMRCVADADTVYTLSMEDGVGAEDADVAEAFEDQEPIICQRTFDGDELAGAPVDIDGEVTAIVKLTRDGVRTAFAPRGGDREAVDRYVEQRGFRTRVNVDGSVQEVEPGTMGGVEIERADPEPPRPTKNRSAERFADPGRDPVARSRSALRGSAGDYAVDSSLAGLYGDGADGVLDAANETVTGADRVYELSRPDHRGYFRKKRVRTKSGGTTTVTAAKASARCSDNNGVRIRSPRAERNWRRDQRRQHERGP